MKIKSLSYIFLFWFFLLSTDSKGQVRSTLDFNKDWKFFEGNDSTASQVIYDDSKWRKLSLPHDWSIESNFIKDAPATNQGGSLPGGIGWYRKTFTLPVSAKDKNVSIEFDGVYKNSEVWINGHYLSKRPNGYVAFSYDLTSYLLPSPQKNVIAVKVDNTLQPDSRWYSGSGIYRNVKLILTGKIFIETGGIFITALPKLTDTAEMEITIVLTTSFKTDQKITLVNTVYDKSGKLVAQKKPFEFETYFEGSAIVQKMKIAKPVLWSIDKPELYTLKTQLFKSGRLTDEVNTSFGIRYFDFDSNKGFSLN